ncbi:hypothetical protein E1B28_007272 [Marasmius oreades]|nr:uncharacterized protein E1B28_007272 [Marasmius oreades]KAG7093607.1 hypothetical protein E1B28_007272 [Marasmius oreades]
MDMTAQCTDQCVIITCSDPAHDDADSCTGAVDTDLSCCDVWCQDECKDCDDIDKLLACCPDFPSFTTTDASTGSQQHLQNSWDDIEAFFCSCSKGNSESHASYNSPGASCSFCENTHSKQQQERQEACYHYPSHTSPLPFPSTMPSFIPPSTEPIPFSTTTTPSTASSPTLQDLICMWADCQGQFTSLETLIDHINSQHFVEPSNFTCQPSSKQDSTNCQISCLWGNCNQQLFADFVASDSAQPTDVSADDPGQHHLQHFNALSMHLFEDHLNFQNTAVNQSQGQVQPSGQLLVAENAGAGENHYDFSFPRQEEEVFNLDTPSCSPSSPASPPAPSSHILTSSSLSSPTDELGTTDGYTCRWDSCQQTFDTCTALTEHLTKVHVGSGKQRYECLWEGCTRNYRNRNGGGGKEGGFTSKQKICRHLQSHTGHRPYQCAVCQQNFSEVATLQQHMRRHTREKPYVCDYPGCGKAFAIAGALTIHKRTHNGQKPFKCTFCGRAFAESSNLSKHLRTHTGVRPYVCPEPGCGKSFARPDQLTRHSGVHQKKKGKKEDEEEKVAS